MTDVRGGEITGGKLPAEAWKRFMKAVADVDVGGFPKPKNVGAGEQLHPELNTTTTTAPPTTRQPPSTPSTDRPRPDPTWPKPTWPTTTERGNGGGRPPTSPSTPTTRGPGTDPPGQDEDD
jgi:hypothetical protein